MDQFKLYRRYLQQNGHVAKTELIATIMPNHLQELIFEMAHYAENARQNFSKLTCDQVQKIFARRINLNISRKQAAKLANLDLNTYTTIEQGILFNNLNLYKQVLEKLESVK